MEVVMRFYLITLMFRATKADAVELSAVLITSARSLHTVAETILLLAKIPVAAFFAPAAAVGAGWKLMTPYSTNLAHTSLV